MNTAAQRTLLSLRLPSRILQPIDDYAKKHSLTRTDAIAHFLDAGIKAEEAAHAENRTDKKLNAIQEQLEQIQSLLSPSKTATVREETQRVHRFIQQIAKKYPAIQKAFLFGSFARGTFSPESDVDVRIELDPSEPFNLHDLSHFAKEIEQLTGREVDVVSARVIKNPALAAAIEREKVLVYERQA